MSAWISVQLQLPTAWESVLVATSSPGATLEQRKYDGQQVAYLQRHSDGVLRFASDYHEDAFTVTHWQPLPTPPEAS